MANRLLHQQLNLNKYQQKREEISLEHQANPDAEIIALSPKTLMATNRFVCEVCNKGFQREQNLQLHRRGHNLPWKLKQKSTKEVKRKVYLCPEPTCVHHEPSRALGDLTGIKKHYSRKHGEKKYKCEKCSKKYAVQSDWKAHTKTCGTREYRCDCGTLFSRRDSFITHRAFCDALAQESARNPPSLSSIGSHLYGSINNNNMSLGGLSKLNSQISNHHDMLHFGGNNNNNISGGAHHHHHHNQFDNNNNLIGSSAFRSSSSFFQLPADQTSHQDYGENNNKPSNIHGLMQLPNLHNNTNVATGSSSMFNLNFFQNNHNNNNNNNNNVVDNAPNSNISGGLGGLLLPSPHQFSNNNSGEGSNNSSNIFSSGTLLSDHQHHHHMSSSIPSLYNVSSSPAPPMSATALLQKAAQMGSTTSCNNSSTSASLIKAFGSVVGVGGSSSSTTKSDLHPPPAVNFGSVYGHEDPMSAGNHLHDLVVNAYGAHDQNQDYGGVLGGYNNNNKMNSYDQPPPQKKQMISNNFSMDIGMSEEANRLTRDFLGVGEIVRSMSNGGGGFSNSQQQMSSLDNNNNNSESRKTQSRHHQPFGGGNFQ
ncbi:protein indeterminate-domain 6, chloroplastic-like isoform X2 [Solanum dulcamara]|uniref:protein indeterminate-domain 6, chloroplastic-like isoform X2 n=1 Tax=Solanum dulcamara TaxID=45834 RepID=UPI002486BE33|nr:protein indeterminate-domain 6, chloroplastic-like isoform X2 [Solanum dulcamara]